MLFERHLTRRGTLELTSTELEAALSEMLDVATSRYRDLKKDELIKSLLQRENLMSTYLGNGVALPHTRIPMKRRYIVMVGRSREGIRYDGLEGEEDVHLVILLIAGENSRDYLQMLASIARAIKDESFVKLLVGSPTLDILYQRLRAGLSGQPVPGRRQQSLGKINRMILRETRKIALSAQCSAIFLFGDTLRSMSGLEPIPDLKTILITQQLQDTEADGSPFAATIRVRSFNRSRLSQLRSAVLIGLTRGVISFSDRICCVGGLPASGQFDSIMVVELQSEFQMILADHLDFMPPDVNAEVLERVIGIAMELAVEGREGRPVGCLFVLGDTGRVEKMTKPLVLNPFFGYKEEDRNILNPFMDETVKEFSSLDGAFIIRGDGVLVSAGSLIHAPDYYHSLPSGFGARHAAAAAISLAAQCLSIVVSSSSGQVTVFRRGVSLPMFEKAMGGFS